MATKNVELRQRVSGSFTDNLAVRSDWDIVDNKPDVFPPSAHTHTVDDIDAAGLPDSTTFLRGDGQWISGSGILAFQDAAGEGLYFDTGANTLNVNKASTVEAEAGINDTNFMTPLKTFQAIQENGGGYAFFTQGKTNDALVPGDLVQFAGSQGDHYLVKKVVASELNANPDLFMGVASETAAINDFVKIMWIGLVLNVDLPSTTYALGDILWYDNSAGGFTTTEPTVEPIIQIAAVTKLNDGSSFTGRLLVRPQFKSRKADEIFIEDLDGNFTGTNLESVLAEIAEGGSSVLVSDTAPTSPAEGDLWFDSTDLTLYIYYNDGDGFQWVDVSAGGAVDGAVVNYYTTTIATTDWTGSGPYTAAKTVTGILNTDRPIIDIDLSSVAFANVETVQGEYSKLYRVNATQNDEITFYATETPTEDLVINIQVVN